MKKTVTFKKMVAIASSVFVMTSMLTGMAASAAVTYKTLTYQTGDVSGVVGSTEVSFEKVINTTFDTAAASRFSRKGYTIASWNVPSTGETVALGAQYKMPANDITFVANWKEAEYAVSFAGKGGKTADGKTTIADKATFGTAMTLPQCQFVYNGYTFAGWKYDNKTYKAGEKFEVPALLSGSKIVFAAEWTTGTAVVTTAATKATTTTTTTTTTKATTAATTKATTTTTKATTTTTKAATAATTTTTKTATTTTKAATAATTTATTVAATTTKATTAATTAIKETTVPMTTSENVSVETPVENKGEEVKTFDINAEIDFKDESSKMYNVGLDEIRSYGTMESISINLKAQEGQIGQLVMGIGGNINGTWKQFDYNENIDSESYSINFANGEECENLQGDYLQIGYWYGSSVLYIDSVTVKYYSAENTEPVGKNDYNKDGVTDKNDADALRKYIVGIKVEGFDINETNADVNGDGEINVFDYMALSRKC